MLPMSNSNTLALIGPNYCLFVKGLLFRSNRTAGYHTGNLLAIVHTQAGGDLKNFAITVAGI